MHPMVGSEEVDSSAKISFDILENLNIIICAKHWHVFLRSVAKGTVALPQFIGWEHEEEEIP